MTSISHPTPGPGQHDAHMSFDEMLQRCSKNWDRVWRRLQEEQNDRFHWTGELSTSALSTATAISALVQTRKALQSTASRDGTLPEPTRLTRMIDRGCQWLLAQQNADGGFGDTDLSHSNIATTYLVLAAWQSAEFQCDARDLAWNYVREQGEWDGLRRRYGKDKTFVVPILSSCALAGLVSWKQVPALPFEAAWLPQDWYRLARMPVVSYAIPALVAIGQARFHFAPTRNPILRAIRRRAIRPTLDVLQRMQPASGGYLEATPLTSFVLMNLAAMGKAETNVARNCVRFLVDSCLRDGSWPIDTNLATWVTSLTFNALGRRGELAVATCRSGDAKDPTEESTTQSPSIEHASKSPASKSPASECAGRNESSSMSCGEGTDAVTLNGSLSKPVVKPDSVRWLLACQHTEKHPFTGANPGGWGWTDLSGAVPDADDTPGALLALKHLSLSQSEDARLKDDVYSAVARGLGWLIRLQNRDGGWPTFCRGWGKLPFDRSGSDLTAHAIRAFAAWLEELPQIQRVVERSDAPEGETVRSLPDSRQIEKSMERGFRYLKRQQRSDGCWLPLWFGNQDRCEEDNPIYGTAKVLMAYAETDRLHLEEAQAARAYLESHQNMDGGWGGGVSVPYRVAENGPSSNRNKFASAVSVRSDTGSQPDGVENGSVDAVKCIASNRIGISAADSFAAHSANELGAMDSDAGLSYEIGSTIEETSLALEALVLCSGQNRPNATIMRGLRWLNEALESGHDSCSFPIGFYFAKLWYHEKLYPPIFGLAALGATLQTFSTRPTFER